MKTSLRFALVDANHFYCSCERVFAPGLEGRPVVVLSNNDGCIVSASQESKQLGITRGVPIFQIRPLIRRHRVAVFSSNYTLYGDLSRRVMDTLKHFTPRVEVYSIDEAFVDFTGLEDLSEYGCQMRSTVKQWTGIPVSIGIAQTKTLAKIANRLAKRSELGVFDLTTCNQEQVLASIAIEDVWGIGPRWSKRLRQQGIASALALRHADKAWIRQQMGVIGVRIVWELQGYSCLPLELNPKPRKSVVVSRSFGTPVESLKELKEAVATFTARAAYKLRKENLAAQCLTVFVSTSRFKEPYYNNKKTTSLPVATNHMQELIGYALTLTERLYRKGLPFTKAGVMMMKLVCDDQRQINLFDTCDRERAERLLQGVDEINEQLGRGTLHYGAEGLKQGWQTRAEQRSPRWTTQWSELPIVKA
jgi:DNA polymerase V